MSARAPFTEQTVRKAIKAARKEGLFVHGIRPDGTVIVGENPMPGSDPGIIPINNAEASKWEDVEA